MSDLDLWMQERVDTLEQFIVHVRTELVRARDAGRADPRNGQQATETLLSLLEQEERLRRHLAIWREAAAAMDPPREAYARKVLAYVNSLDLRPERPLDATVNVHPVVYADVIRVAEAGEHLGDNVFTPSEHMEPDAVITNLGLASLPHADLTPEQTIVYQDLRKDGKSIEEATVYALEFTNDFTNTPAGSLEQRSLAGHPHGIRGVRKQQSR